MQTVRDLYMAKEEIVLGKAHRPDLKLLRVPFQIPSVDGGEGLSHFVPLLKVRLIEHQIAEN